MKVLKESEDMSYVEIFPAKITNILKTKVPMDGIGDINKYLDKLLLNEDRVSASHNLAGEIKTGEQLQLDFNNKNLRPISSFILDLAEKYCEQFYKDCNMPISNLSFSISNIILSYTSVGISVDSFA